jgi:hypothetical protein
MRAKPDGDFYRDKLEALTGSREGYTMVELMQRLGWSQTYLDNRSRLNEWRSYGFGKKRLFCKADVQPTLDYHEGRSWAPAGWGTAEDVAVVLNCKVATAHAYMSQWGIRKQKIPGLPMLYHLDDAARRQGQMA